MASNLDTLNIGSLRLRKEYPVAEVQSHRQPDPVIHPDAAAAARARIAALPEVIPFVHPDAVPAAPTADLITDKATLAKQAVADPVSRRFQIPTALRPMLTAAGIFVIVLLLFKAPVILSQLGYSLGKKPSQAVATLPAADETVPAENTITIPKINVHAPVNYEPSITEAAIQKSLESGVVHYGNTAAPGQAGNVAIFGHSSNDWWEPGNYKFVFVLLDKLAPGDRLTIDYQSKRYTYEVTGSRVVEPTAVDVLNPTAEPTLTLITCSPPGTSLRRLVVTAKQVNPDPTQSATAAATPSTTPAAGATAGPDTIPSSAPSFLNQVKQAWNGVVSGFKSLFTSGDSSTPPGASPTPASGLPAVK